MKKFFSILAILGLAFGVLANFAMAADPVLVVTINTPPGRDGQVVGQLEVQPSVTVTDSANGNAVVPGATVTVSADTGTEASITGTKTCITNASGVCTFTDLGYTKTDAFTLKFTATKDGATLNSITAGSMTFVASTPHTLTITSSPTIGYTYQNLSPQPVVTVQDQYDNTVTNDNLPISIEANTKNDFTGTSSEFDGTTLVYTTDGVANFSGIKYNTINTTGIYLCA
jgi:hypothetical protein